MVSQEIRRRKKQQSNDTSKITSPTASAPQSERKDAPKSTTFTQVASVAKYDEYAWFAVFLVALFYFILTRGGGGNRGGLLSKFSKPYEVVTTFVTIGSLADTKDEELLRSIFYVQPKGKKESSPQFNTLTLAPNARPEIIISSPLDVFPNATSNSCPSASCSNPAYLSHLLSTSWIHDADLGRGYLLIADAGRSGRIWRWEVGGGPITIGRSLHMERSGCRSGIWVDECPENLFGNVRNGEQQFNRDEMGRFGRLQSSSPPMLGTASIVAELTRDAERPTESKNIIVAEWGEKRIVRVEGETGARTPLVTMVPISSEEKHGLRRVHHPNHLTYTPFGDLLFSDSYKSNNDQSMATINRLKEAVHVPPILVEHSRDAHGWTGTAGPHFGKFAEITPNIDVLFQTNGWIDGMILGGSNYSTLFVSVVTHLDNKVAGWAKTVYKLSLIAADDDDDDDARADASKTKDAADRHEVLYSMTSNNCQLVGQENNSRLYTGSKLAIDTKDTIYMIGCPSQVLLLSSDDGHVVGKLTFDQLHPDDSQLEQSLTPSRELTSVNFGEDGFIYITTRNELIRMKSRVKGTSIPTNLVVPKSARIDKQSQSQYDERDKQ